MTYPLSAIALGGAAAVVAALAVAALLARTRFPMPQVEGRFASVDGLRGFLAIAVMIHHFVVWMQVARLGGEWGVPDVKWLNQLGASGVALFFMTTGLVFYPRVLAGLRATSWPALFITRVCRIVPLVAVSVLLVLLVSWYRVGAAPDAGLPWAILQWLTAWGEPPLLGYAMAGRVNAYVFWTLGFEWRFYLLILPACAAVRDLTRQAWATWILPAGMVILLLVARAVDGGSPVIAYAPLFGLGMLAHEVARRPAWAAMLRSTPAAAISTVGLVISVTIFRFGHGAAMPALFLFFACVASGNRFGGLLRSRAALVLGSCSFGIYLLHGIVLSLMFVEGSALIRGVSTPMLPVLLPLVAVVVVLASAAGYVLVEHPMIGVGRHLAALWTGRRARAMPLETEVAP